MKSRLTQLIFLVLFSVLLATPLVLRVFGIKESFLSFENKKQSSQPSFDLSNLDPFPGQYETWYTDHFPLRNTLLFGYNYCNARFLGKSPKPEMLTIGKKGWLYMTNDEMNIYQGKEKFDSTDLKKSLKEIEYRRKECAAIGADYYVVIIPDKQTVYPEYLPDGLKKASGPNATDQLIGYLRQHSSLKLLDLRPALIAGKKYGPLYLKGDNHWNELGAFVGYREIVNWLRKDISIAEPLGMEEVEIHDTVTRGGNMIGMLGMEWFWKETRKKVNPLHPFRAMERKKMNYAIPSKFAYTDLYEGAFQNTDNNLPGLFVVHESFTTVEMKRFLASSFGRSTFIFDKWEHRLNKDILLQEKPKVVICMLLESFVHCFERNPDNPELNKK
jgi:alginate O-acetyltransferase complex protein AlgJ